MKIKDGFIIKELAGSYVVVPVGENVVDFDLMMTLNESSAFLWNCLSQHQTVDQLVDQLTKEYAIDPDTARADIEEFIQQLKDKKVLED